MRSSSIVVVFVAGALTVVTPRLASAGCSKDTDCKGDRVCENGACVSPTATPEKASGQKNEKKGDKKGAKSDDKAVEAPAASADPAALVRVTMESNEPKAVLAKIVGMGVAYASGPGGYASASSTDYEMVCTVPCNKEVDRNYQYVIQNVSGFGGVSNSFVLPARNEVTLKVESKSQGLYVGGLLGGSFGASGLIVGLTFMGVGAGVDNGGFVKAGVITTLISLPLTIWGFYSMSTNATSVVTEQSETLARAPAEEPGVKLAATPMGVGLTF